MITITYQLTPANLESYQSAVRDRLNNLPSNYWWASRHFQTFGVLAAALALVLFADWAVKAVGWPPLDIVSIMIGAYAGIFAVYAAMWARHLATRHSIVRPNGPTQLPHTMTLSADDVNAASRDVTAHYKWAMFTDVTERPDIAILWYEPSAGIIIPNAAFATPADQTAFVAFAKQHIPQP
jgi:hypothetical protein